MANENVSTNESNIEEQNIESSSSTSTTEPVSNDSSTVESNSSEATPEIRTSDDLRAYEATQKSKKDAAKQSKPEVKKASTTTDFGPVEKQLKELRDLNNRQARELGELRKWKGEKSKVFDSYEQTLKQQQEQELLNKFQDDPAAVVRELAQRESQAALQPYAPIIAKAQAVEINTQLQSLAGEDYEHLAPIMADVIDKYMEMDAANGTNYAQEIANQPAMLKAIARDIFVDNSKVQTAQNAAASQQKKAQNLRIANGVAKNNNTSSSPPADFSSLSLDQMRQQLKQQGILK